MKEYSIAVSLVKLPVIQFSGQYVPYSPINCRRCGDLLVDKTRNHCAGCILIARARLKSLGA